MERNLENILIILGVISIVYYIGLSMFTVSFAKAWLIIGILLILFGIIKKFKKESVIFEKRIFKNKAIYVVFLLIIASFLCIETLIIYNGNNKDTTKSDYIVILGAGLKGSKMSLTLYNRVSQGLKYIQNNPQVKIILSGGKGKDEAMSEAEAMRRFLINKGVSEKRIIKEEKSTNTWENIKFTKEKLKGIDKRDNIKITIVTSDFHVFRAKFLAKRLGIKALGFPSQSHPLLVPNYYLREYFAVIKSLVLDTI